MNVATAAPASKQTALKPFRRGTRQQFVQLDNVNLTSWSQRATIVLPQTGFLSRIRMRVAGSLTTGAGTPVGTWTSYPFSPWNLVAKIRLYTSSAFPLWDTSGIGAYAFDLFTRRSQNRMTNPYDSNATKTRANNFAALSGSTAASTVYPIASRYELPLVMDDLSQRGLLQLQTTRSRLNLEVTLAAQTDVTAVTGVTVTPNINVETSCEVFSEPNPDEYQWPDLSWVPTVTEDIAFVGSTGTQRYKPNIGSQYARLIGIVENAGATVNCDKITNLAIRFSQGVFPYSETYYGHTGVHADYLGLDIPEGFFGYDFTRGSGVPGILDTRDLFNTALLSDFEQDVTLDSSLTLTNAQIRYIRHQVNRRS